MTTLKYMLGAVLPLCLSGSYVSAEELPKSTAVTITTASQSSVRDVNYRKNIDDLTADELKAYEHAVETMKRKSQENVYDRTGFLWQAWVHNCPAIDVLDGRQAPLSEEKLKRLLGNQNLDSCKVRNFLSVKGSAKMHPEYPGECEHQKNTFLQWHRAELYYYEQALQAADPEGLSGPSTKNVSLPYWNFTKKPTGTRYPKAFENPSSPLFDSTRNAEPLSSPLPTASPYLLSYIINFQDWQTFGGDVYGANGGGDLETKIHNQMHATYVGGNMGNNATAAMDPIFYVFHNFIDYSFDEWIKKHDEKNISGNGRTNYMRAEQNADLLNPVGFNEGSGDKKRTDSGDYLANMGQAELYFDSKKQGYGFLSNQEEFIQKDKVQALIDKHEQAGFVFGDNEVSLFSALLSYGASGAAAVPQIKISSPYTIPDHSVSKSWLSLVWKALAGDYDFQADVYLYPGNVTENIGDLNFRNRYLVTNTAHWALTGPHSNGELDMKQDITGIVNSLVGTKKGKVWQVTLAISGKEVQAKYKKDFLPPTIEESQPPINSTAKTLY